MDGVGHSLEIIPLFETNEDEWQSSCLLSNAEDKLHLTDQCRSSSHAQRGIENVLLSQSMLHCRGYIMWFSGSLNMFQWNTWIQLFHDKTLAQSLFICCIRVWDNFALIWVKNKRWAEVTLRLLCYQYYLCLILTTYLMITHSHSCFQLFMHTANINIHTESLKCTEAGICAVLFIRIQTR